MQPRRFILQALDPDHGSPAFEMMFLVERLQVLRDILGVDAANDLEFEYEYPLDPALIAAINERFGLHFDALGREARLCPWSSLREVPYLAHTGYELPLLLEGRKQFARMYQEYPPARHEHEELFDRFVAQGILHKEVELEPFDQPLHNQEGVVLEGIRTAYYTRKGEEWRIVAWKLIWSAAQKSCWSEDFERLEGMLLGYDEWQNDWWIAQYRKCRPA